MYTSFCGTCKAWKPFHYLRSTRLGSVLRRDEKMSFFGTRLGKTTEPPWITPIPDCGATWCHSQMAVACSCCICQIFFQRLQACRPFVLTMYCKPLIICGVSLFVLRPLKRCLNPSFDNSFHSCSLIPCDWLPLWQENNVTFSQEEYHRVCQQLSLSAVSHVDTFAQHPRGTEIERLDDDFFIPGPGPRCHSF